MKFVAALLLTALGFQAHAGNINDYIGVHAQEIQSKELLRLQTVATDMVRLEGLSKEEGSCGDVITFKGPTGYRSAENMQLWIHGIATELGTINLDEDIKLFPAPMRYSDLRLKVTILADRSMLSYDVKNVEEFTKEIYSAIQPAKDHYFFFGDYLDTETGWMTAMVFVKISSGEAVFISHSSRCY
ncbi:hypothetical protein [Bdellovibrio sp. HCB337]|uniref:hypothetical protein n=1 Tax=Bdellovibrio sp. HCB337 TaxID=3394358 RepID=UPI0039A74705